MSLNVCSMCSAMSSHMKDLGKARKMDQLHFFIIESKSYPSSYLESHSDVDVACIRCRSFGLLNRTQMDIT